MSEQQNDRRAFLKTIIVGGVSTLATVSAFGATTTTAEHHKAAKGKEEEHEEKGEDVSPTEDLMREHGVLNRVLLIYDDAATKLAAKQPFPRDVLVKSSGIIRQFIEDYHERGEEEDIFPRLKKAGKLTDLVDVLLAQHKAGRAVTSRLREMLASDASYSANPDNIAAALRAFNRMYRPHEAREDTVVFPEFRKVVSEHEMDEIGERFEDKEHELFGKEGFESVVAQVAELEKTIGIYDLAKFTPA